jgi:hypothetical protein
VDNTLSLLYNSARSRGLSHDLTKNLSWLFKGHRTWAQSYYGRLGSHWRPNLPRDAPEYQIRILDSKERRRQAKEQESRVVTEAAWGALGEVVGVAEGRHGISLGKMTHREKEA